MRDDQKKTIQSHKKEGKHMCRTGGPYCYSHMSTRLQNAKERIKKRDTPFARKSLVQATMLYDSTPKGQEELEAVVAQGGEKAEAAKKRLEVGRKLRESHLEQQKERKQVEKSKKDKNSVKSSDSTASKETVQEPSVKKGARIQPPQQMRFVNVDTSHLDETDPRTGEKYTVDENRRRHSYGDKPAVVHPNGAQIWQKHGTFHRDGDKPSMIHPNGRLEYRKDGVPHRENPHHPGAVSPQGEFRFYRNGEEVAGENTSYAYTDEKGQKQSVEVPVAIAEKLKNYEEAAGYFDSRGYAELEDSVPQVVSYLKQKNHREATSVLNRGFETLSEMNQDSQWLNDKNKKRYEDLAHAEKNNPIIHLPDTFYTHRARS